MILRKPSWSWRSQNISSWEKTTSSPVLQARLQLCPPPPRPHHRLLWMVTDSWLWLQHFVNTNTEIPHNIKLSLYRCRLVHSHIMRSVCCCPGWSCTFSTTNLLLLYLSFTFLCLKNCPISCINFWQKSNHFIDDVYLYIFGQDCLIRQILLMELWKNWFEIQILGWGGPQHTVQAVLSQSVYEVWNT